MSASQGDAGVSTPLLLDVPAQALLGDPLRGVFYGTVQGSASQHANSLVVIDGSTGQVTESTFIGSQPSTMALSDDASTLWVSLRGSNEIRRVDLSSGLPIPGAKHAVPKGSTGDLTYAGPMVVLPGTKESVAISLRRENVSPNYAGTVIVDGGVPRPGMTPGHSGASQLVAGPPNWLFGYNDLSTEFGFYTLAVSPNGLTPTKYQYLVSGFSTSIVYANERIYSSDGTVLDVSAPEAPQKSGTFAFSGLAVLPLPNSTCTLMLSPGTPTADSLTLRLLDGQTFTQVDSKAYPLDLAYTFDLVIADGGWLAFRGFNSFQSPRVYILENPFAGSW